MSYPFLNIECRCCSAYRTSYNTKVIAFILPPVKVIGYKCYNSQHNIVCNNTNLLRSLYDMKSVGHHQLSNK